MIEYTKKYYTNIWINAAKYAGIDYEILDKREGYVIYKRNGKELRSVGCKFDVNNIVSSWIARNKHITIKVLSKITDFVPNQQIFDLSLYEKDGHKIIQDIYTYVANKDFLVVIKAIDLAMGNGIYLLPQNMNEIKVVVDELYEKYRQTSLIIEDYFSADAEYRVLTYKGQIINAFLRLPAYVIGHDRKTIAELIIEKNIEREKHGFKLIKMDDLMKTHLESKNKSLSDILDDDQRIILRNTCNLAQGGETERIDELNFHNDYKYIFECIYRETKLDYAGLDLMVKGSLANKPSKGTLIINEINTAPSIDVAYFADISSTNPFRGAGEILIKLLEG
jgi:D-alanine-D-alanine ligase-like ATP-grasp enzyme